MIGKRDLNKGGQPEYFALIRWLLKKIITYITYNILKNIRNEESWPRLAPFIHRIPCSREINLKSTAVRSQLDGPDFSDCVNA